MGGGGGGSSVSPPLCPPQPLLSCALPDTLPRVLVHSFGPLSLLVVVRL